MLEDVGDAGGVLGHGREEDREGVVVVLGLNVDVSRPGAIVLELQVGAFQALEGFATPDGVPADGSEARGCGL